MNEFVRYLLQSAACLTALYLVYWFFLRRDTFFTMNRIYLLLAGILSLVIPLFPLRFLAGGPMTPVVVLLDPVLITPQMIENTTLYNIGWFVVAGVVYLTGVMIFSVRFLIQVIQLLLIVKKQGITRRDGMKMVLVDRGYSPFSFFNLIFIKKEYAENNRLSAIIEHERIHIRQLHTADLVIMELLTIVQWFNPFAWLLQRSVKAVHEYLADEGVLRKGISGNDYRRLIFDQTLGMQVNNLTNNFNVSLIKKRMIMMTQSRSAKMAGLKAIFALPVLFAVVLFFSAGSMNPVSAQDKNATSTKTALDLNAPVYGTDKNSMPDNQPEYPGGMDALVQFLLKNIHYPKDAMKKGTQGTVFVNFIVETDGSISNTQVMRGIGKGCDEESIRVVNLMPNWKPGSMKDGKPVRVKYVLPIKFALDGKKK